MKIYSLKLATISFLIPFMCQSKTFGETVESNGVSLEVQWKKGNVVWYAPALIPPEMTEEKYDRCAEELTTLTGWTQKPSVDWQAPPCILIPPKEEDWVLKLTEDYQHLRTLEADQETALPEEQVPREKLVAKFLAMQKKYRKHCPATFESVVYNGIGDTNPEVACTGGIKKLSCKQGFVYHSGECSRKIWAPCVGVKQDGHCYSCNYGGALDHDEKHTTVFCDGIGMGGACSTQYYCKVETENIVAPE